MSSHTITDAREYWNMSTHTITDPLACGNMPIQPTHTNFFVGVVNVCLVININGGSKYYVIGLEESDGEQGNMKIMETNCIHPFCFANIPKITLSRNNMTATINDIKYDYAIRPYYMSDLISLSATNLKTNMTKKLLNNNLVSDTTVIIYDNNDSEFTIIVDKHVIFINRQYGFDVNKKYIMPNDNYNDNDLEKKSCHNGKTSVIKTIHHDIKNNYFSCNLIKYNYNKRIHYNQPIPLLYNGNPYTNIKSELFMLNDSNEQNKLIFNTIGINTYLICDVIRIIVCYLTL